MQLSDDPNELLIQVSLSNRRAFKKLYEMTSAKLFGVSLRITKQESLSEEALQDGFVKIWHNAHRFDAQKAQAITWMGTIVRNQSIDLMRKNVKHDEAGFYEQSIDDVAGDTETPEQLAMKAGDLQAVNHCMGTLVEAHKELILMAYLEGYSHQQIAEAKSMPVGSVKTWIHRGVKALKQCLNQAQ